MCVFFLLFLFVWSSQSPLDEPVVLTDEVIFPLTVSLDKLPVSTLKVKVCHFGQALVKLSYSTLYCGFDITFHFLCVRWLGDGDSVEEGGGESRGAGTWLSECPATTWTNTHLQTWSEHLQGSGYKHTQTERERDREKICCNALHVLILPVILVIDDRGRCASMHKREQERRWC